MNILLNLSSVRQGGGQQVASNFLTQLAEHKGFGHNWVLLVGENTNLWKQAKALNLTHVVCNINYLNRYIFEQKELPKIIKNNHIDIIYHYAPCFKNVAVPQVIRTVFSNLYFPEIDFWTGISPLAKFKKKLIDYFRLKRTLLADGIIFENKAMMERAQTLFKRKPEDLIYIAPSVTAFKDLDSSAPKNKLAFFNVLILSSWHPNKNIHLVPDVLVCLAQDGITDVCFTLSLSKDDPGIQHFVEDCRKKGVLDRIRFIGMVAPADVRKCYEDSDAVVLLSKLECFSSNIIESWSFQRPLIIADEPWARAICEDAVLYVNRDDARQIADAIRSLKENPQLAETLRKKGVEELKNYNTPQEKVEKQIAFLEKIYQRKK